MCVCLFVCVCFVTPSLTTALLVSSTVEMLTSMMGALEVGEDTALVDELAATAKSLQPQMVAYVETTMMNNPRCSVRVRTYHAM